MTLMPYTFDETTLRNTFSQYPSGIAALAAHVDGNDHVFIVATFNVGISLSPPLVSFAVQLTSTTWPLLRQAQTIGISILSANQSNLCRQLASKDKEIRWSGVDIERTDTGSIFIGHAALAFECSIHAEYPAGDHEIVLLEVKSFCSVAELDPLVFHGSRFRSLEAIV